MAEYKEGTPRTKARKEKVQMEKLHGYKKLDFSDDNGNPVKGTQLYTSYPEDGVTGEACGKLFIRDGIDIPPLTVGMMLDITYNRKGKAVAVKAATAAPAKA